MDGLFSEAERIYVYAGCISDPWNAKGYSLLSCRDLEYEICPVYFDFERRTSTGHVHKSAFRQVFTGEELYIHDRDRRVRSDRTSSFPHIPEKDRRAYGQVPVSFRIIACKAIFHLPFP